MCLNAIRTRQIPVKKIIRVSVILLLVMGLLSTCNGGFNPIMYNHLKKLENYVTATATVTEIGYISEGDPYLKCVFDDREVAEDFLGGLSQFADDPLRLMLPKKSYWLLTERDFFKTLSVGDTITVTASPFIYMDGEFWYIAAITHDGTEYLSFDEGLRNIKRMMRRNPSML